MYYAGFTLEMHALWMQAPCRTHAACCILHTVVCRLHTGVIRATCRLHLEKYDLYFKNAIVMKPACRLQVTLSVATSIEMQLSIPCVDDALN